MIRVPAGPAAFVSQGQVQVILLPRDPAGRPREALLLRDDRGELRAYLNRCEHLPIPLNAGGPDFLTADRRELLCRTHGARYRLEDGHCVHGPCAGRALRPLALSVEADCVYVLLEEDP